MIAQLNPKQIMNINFSPKHINKKLPLLFLLIFSFVLVIPSQILAQGTVVSGKITSSTGDPLQGASVQVKGSKKGTSTDNNGQFSLSVPTPDAILVVTSAGYTRMEVQVQGRSIVPISMTTSTRELEQVV